MEQHAGRVIPVAIEDEVRVSYLNYAMSVIVSRALPDARDGLKPVHRRILYSMNEMGLRSDKTFKKAGRIVGDVLGKFHPHGDMSIYDALVRLAQDFSLRYPLIKGQGNFGSVDGDPPAAMRYTEAKMQKIADEMMDDIKKETVDFVPNYDDSMVEPSVLPASFPMLLANGSSGIAVGMATNMAPHNLNEIGKAIALYIENPEAPVEELMKVMKGPDFPTGGLILGMRGIRDAFKTGRGRIIVRARCMLETSKTGKEAIIVTEIPYMVNKANLVIQIAELIRDKRIDGISDLRDESDRNGMRIVMELKRGAIPKVILNNLYAHTNLQNSFSVNNLALVKGLPKTMNLKDLIVAFVAHRFEVVTRRAKYDLKKAEERAHILEGLKIALDNIDEVIAIIKQSKTVETARTNLMARFSFSELQVQAILDMRLQKLTSLETQKIIDELNEVMSLIKYLKELLADDKKIYKVVSTETEEICKKFGDERRTEIVVEEAEEIDIEDLIKKEDMVVLITNRGFIKRIPVSAYKNQNRGGKGSASATLKEEDFLEHLFIASTHDYVLFITSEGKAYWLKVHEIPEASRNARGVVVKSLLAVSPEEEITTIVALQEFSEETFIFMGTSKAVVKKVKTSDFSNAKTRGIIAINLDNGDKLISALLTTGKDEVVLISRKGIALRYNEEAVRTMGRSSHGVRGMSLLKGDELAGLMKVNANEAMLLISEYGYGKRVNYDNFTPHGRGTRGQTAYKITEDTGEVVKALSVSEKDEIVCISSKGNTLKLLGSAISVLGKTARGVKVVSIDKPDFVVGAARVIAEEVVEVNVGIEVDPLGDTDENTETMEQNDVNPIPDEGNED